MFKLLAQSPPRPSNAFREPPNEVKVELADFKRFWKTNAGWLLQLDFHSRLARRRQTSSCNKHPGKTTFMASVSREILSILQVHVLKRSRWLLIRIHLIAASNSSTLSTLFPTGGWVCSQLFHRLICWQNVLMRPQTSESREWKR